MKRHDVPRRRRGETITEALVSILLIALVFVSLATAVTAAARINAKTDPAAAAFLYPGEQREAGARVHVGGDVVDAVLLKTGNEGGSGYYYYEYKR